MGPAEWVAVLLAVGYLVLAIRQNPWCWVSGAASAVIYLAIFFRTGLWMQAALQIFYVAMSVYGWYAWRHGAASDDGGLRVSRWPVGRHAAAIAIALALALANGFVLQGTDSVLPYVDSLVAWVSVLATWMTARKLLASWLYWILVDLIAMGLYWTQGLHVTTGLFLLYVLLAVRGYREWRSSLAKTTVGDGARADA
jgi:nicotinamide mononucleotide transporter